jgi:hypothetical protein
MRRCLSADPRPEHGARGHSCLIHPQGYVVVGGRGPLHVLEGPGSPHFLSALGTSVAIAGSAVLIPVFWERYFQLLRDCKSCSLPLEVVYSFAALLIPVAALLIVASPPFTAGPPGCGHALMLRARYVAAAYVSAALPIVALRLHWNWLCNRPRGRRIGLSRVGVKIQTGPPLLPCAAQGR